MTKINHHLTDALLMGYAAGTLPEGFSLVAAAHISLCDDCRARMMEFDEVGGAVVDQESPVAMGVGSLAATMERIRTARPVTAPTPKKRNEGLPAPLADYIGNDLEAVAWRKLGAGVRQANIDVDPSTHMRLLYIPAGQAVPDHGHRGTELTLVLQGAFRDEVDRFSVGDIEVATQDLDHQPIAEDGVDCICLAVTDAPLRFNGFLPRLAQRFLRI